MQPAVANFLANPDLRRMSRQEAAARLAEVIAKTSPAAAQLWNSPAKESQQQVIDYANQLLAEHAGGEEPSAVPSPAAGHQRQPQQPQGEGGYESSLPDVVRAYAPEGYLEPAESQQRLIEQRAKGYEAPPEIGWGRKAAAMGARIIPPIGGAFIGGIPGAAGGGLVGEGLARAIEGKPFAWEPMVGEAAMSAVPFVGKGSTLLRHAAMRAGQGAALGGLGSPVRAGLEGQPTWTKEQGLAEAGLGGLFAGTGGVALEAGLGKLAGRPAWGPDVPPGGGGAVPENRPRAVRGTESGDRWTMGDEPIMLDRPVADEVTGQSSEDVLGALARRGAASLIQGRKPGPPTAPGAAPGIPPGSPPGAAPGGAVKRGPGRPPKNPPGAPSMADNVGQPTAPAAGGAAANPAVSAQMAAAAEIRAEAAKTGRWLAVTNDGRRLQLGGVDKSGQRVPFAKLKKTEGAKALPYSGTSLEQAEAIARQQLSLFGGKPESISIVHPDGTVTPLRPNPAQAGPAPAAAAAKAGVSPPVSPAPPAAAAGTTPSGAPPAAGVGARVSVGAEAQDATNAGLFALIDQQGNVVPISFRHTDGKLYKVGKFKTAESLNNALKGTADPLDGLYVATPEGKIAALQGGRGKGATQTEVTPPAAAAAAGAETGAPPAPEGGAPPVAKQESIVGQMDETTLPPNLQQARQTARSLGVLERIEQLLNEGKGIPFLDRELSGRLKLDDSGRMQLYKDIIESMIALRQKPMAPKAQPGEVPPLTTDYKAPEGYRGIVMETTGVGPAQRVRVKITGPDGIARTYDGIPRQKDTGEWATSQDLVDLAARLHARDTEGGKPPPNVENIGGMQEPSREKVDEAAYALAGVVRKALGQGNYSAEQLPRLIEEATAVRAEQRPSRTGKGVTVTTTTGSRGAKTTWVQGEGPKRGRYAVYEPVVRWMRDNNRLPEFLTTIQRIAQSKTDFPDSLDSPSASNPQKTIREFVWGPSDPKYVEGVRRFFLDNPEHPEYAQLLQRVLSYIKGNETDAMIDSKVHTFMPDRPWEFRMRLYRVLRTEVAATASAPKLPPALSGAVNDVIGFIGNEPPRPLMEFIGEIAEADPGVGALHKWLTDASPAKREEVLAYLKARSGFQEPGAPVAEQPPAPAAAAAAAEGATDWASLPILGTSNDGNLYVQNGDKVFVLRGGDPNDRMEFTTTAKWNVGVEKGRLKQMVPDAKAAGPAERTRPAPEVPFQAAEGPGIPPAPVADVPPAPAGPEPATASASQPGPSKLQSLFEMGKDAKGTKKAVTIQPESPADAAPRPDAAPVTANDLNSAMAALNITGTQRATLSTLYNKALAAGEGGVVKGYNGERTAQKVVSDLNDVLTEINAPFRVEAQGKNVVRGSGARPT